MSSIIGFWPSQSDRRLQRWTSHRKSDRRTDAFVLQLFANAHQRHADASVFCELDPPQQPQPSDGEQAAAQVRGELMDVRQHDDEARRLAIDIGQHHRLAIKQTLDHDGQPAENAPPAQDLRKLRKAGLTVVEDEEFAQAVRQLKDRRRRLLGMVEIRPRNGEYR